MIALTSCFCTAISRWMLRLHHWRLCITIAMCHGLSRNLWKVLLCLCTLHCLNKNIAIIIPAARLNASHSRDTATETSSLWRRHVFWRTLREAFFSKSGLHNIWSAGHMQPARAFYIAENVEVQHRIINNRTNSSLVASFWGFGLLSYLQVPIFP